MHKIISVGGSIIIPKKGFNIPFLKKFRSLIVSEVKKGTKLVLIIGGGVTCREYQQAASSVTRMSQNDLDWLGIHTTRLNAEFVRRVFGKFAHGKVVTDPTKKIRFDNILVAGGWKPGWSTDMDAVLFAKTYGAKEVINLSNIKYVYTKDPNKHKDAKKIEKIDWKTFRKEIVGNKWSPGKNLPFDPIASREAQKQGVRVSILDGTNLDQVKQVLEGKSFRGTVIY